MIIVIKEEIGNGSFGKISLIDKDGSLVARKTLKKQDSTAFIEEIQKLKLLRHRNVLIYVDSNENEKGEEFYVDTEYFENGDLLRLIKKQKAENKYFSIEVYINIIYIIENNPIY